MLLCTDPGRAVSRRGFFWLDRTWGKHWHFSRGSGAVARLAPLLFKLGVLAPVRHTAEPGAVFLLDPRDLVERSILESGDWQPEIWSALSGGLPEGGVLLDVGAHIGYFSIRAAVKIGPKGRVVAFEPDPRTLKSLRANVAASNAANVTIEGIACTDREQVLTFYASNSLNTAQSSLSRQNATISLAPPEPFTVPGRPIDSVVRELGLERVDVVKVDVEGAELLVLRGAVETLGRFHPRLIIEVNPKLLANFQATPEDVFNLIKSVGYTQGAVISEYDWVWTTR
jgi:FkbM family methyltransferase